MKKSLLLLLTICMMGLFTTVAHAQSIVGTWTADARELIGSEIPGLQKVTLIFTYNANGTSTMSYDIGLVMQEDGIGMDLGIKATLRGTYKKTGNNLFLDYDKDSAKVDLYKLNLKLTPEMEQALAAVGMTKNQMTEMIKQQIDPKDFTAGLDNMGGNTVITKLTQTTLVLTDNDGKSITLTRK